MNSLDEALYQAGKELIEHLDNEGFNYPVILWIREPDADEWKLLFGIPGLKVIGENDIFGNLRRIIRENELKLSVSNIILEDSLGILCQNLKSVYRIGPKIGKAKFSPTVINGYKLPESIIYRVI